MKTSKQNIAIYPGTFDPVTFGHIDIIKRSATIFDKLIIGVASNIAKNPLFSAQKRCQMLEDDISSLRCAKQIEVKIFDGLLVNFAHQEDAKIIVRGLRALSDFEYEFQMAFMNYKMSPDIETIFIPASEDGNLISSGFVKEIASLGENLTNFVSKNTANQLHQKYSIAK